MARPNNNYNNNCNTSSLLSNNNSKIGQTNNAHCGPNIQNNRDANGRVVKLNSRRVSLGDANQGHAEGKNQKLIMQCKREKGNCTPNFEKERSVEKDSLNYSHRVIII